MIVRLSVCEAYIVELQGLFAGARTGDLVMLSGQTL